MGSLDQRRLARLKRKKRIRKSMFGTQQRPRLSIFRSAKHIYAQIINDATGHTLSSASTLEQVVKDFPDYKNRISVAIFVGKLIAERANKKGIKKVVFDRNGFLYHGRVKAVSDGAREAGLDF
ncbi:MAG: 50S ribosomal protein L18 [Proteobacteria bacterium]|nr:50S ribosomal protein L18 [Pseudomonadota bacterium]MBU4259753.1 50S ribosomal protein L18 [Pseudomonadota bacterium]MCG2758811.1 50S ribosomal protein L18 [Desulfobacteraceae bacterium]